MCGMQRACERVLQSTEPLLFTHPVLHRTAPPAHCCAVPWLLRGLGVAGPIISPCISLRRVSARLSELCGAAAARSCDPLTVASSNLSQWRRFRHTPVPIPLDLYFRKFGGNLLLVSHKQRHFYTY